MGRLRTCQICHRPDAGDLNKDLTSGVITKADVMRKYGIKSRDTIQTHLNKCLGTTMQQIAEDKKKRDILPTIDRLMMNLEHAEMLRDAAKEYLSDPNDPLRYTLIPRATEIEVVYYDWKVKDENGNPKKKTATLHELLAIMADSGLEAELVRMKHVDIRKFALDAVAQTDACLDKFARIEGLYQKSRPNALDPKALTEQLTERLVARGWDPEDARTYAINAYADIQPANDAIH